MLQSAINSQYFILKLVLLLLQEQGLHIVQIVWLHSRNHKKLWLMNRKENIWSNPFEKIRLVCLAITALCLLILSLRQIYKFSWERIIPKTFRLYIFKVVIIRLSNNRQHILKFIHTYITVLKSELIKTHLQYIEILNLLTKFRYLNRH